MKRFWLTACVALMIVVSSIAVPTSLRAQATSSSTDNSSSVPDTTGASAPAPLVDAPAPQQNDPAQPAATDQPGTISGTVTDANGDLVSGVNVTLEGVVSADRRIQAVNDSGFFDFTGLKAGVPYRVSISGVGFQKWSSQPVVLTPGQFFNLTGIKLTLTNEAPR